MEGINVAGILAGYLAVLEFAITAVVAFGLLIARRTKGARTVFAAGLWCATIIAGLAVLSFLAPEFGHDASLALIALTMASLLLAGAGQFVAALQGARTYAASFGCAALSLMLLASPLLAGDWGAQILGRIGLIDLPQLGIPLLVVASLLAAMASVGIAAVPFFRSRTHPGGIPSPLAR